MKTVLYNRHVDLGARIVDFHGWDMPLEYGSILNEHMAVRSHVGIFDVSHMGDITITGKDSVSFLDHVLPSNISKMKSNEAQYTAFLDESGNMIDDTIVYRMNDDSFFFVPNASTTDLIYEWVKKNSNGYDISIKNVSDKLSCIAVQGPQSTEVAENMGIKFPEFFTFHYQDSEHVNYITGTEGTIVSGTGYTGEKGFELIVPNEDTVKIWNDLYDIVKKKEGLPCGLGSRDSLRMEKGMLLSGTDFNNNRTPYESGVSFIVDSSKDFIGKENLVKRKEEQKEFFRGFILDTKMIPRSGNAIMYNGNKIGTVTSGTYSPVLGKSIALGYILKNSVKKGDPVEIEIRNRNFNATVGRPKTVP